MSVVRKVTVAIATLFLGFSAMFLTTGTAAADCPWNSPVPCRSAN